MKLGTNGEGCFENLDDFSKSKLKELGDVVMRFPGGPISRFSDPFTTRKGWGITPESVNYFFDNYEVGAEEDDPGGSREKWLGKEAAQPEYSYMDSLISLSQEMPGLSIIFVANVFTSTTEAQFAAIQYLKQGGVRIEAVEFGNEVYGKYDFNTANYIATCEPIIALIKESYPEIKISLISGNFKGRRDHDQWNEQLAVYVNNPVNKIDYVTLHFYIGSDIAPEAYSLLPPPKVIDYSTVDVSLKEACDAYFEEVLLLERFQEEIDMAKSLYNTGVIVTEWNNNPAASWCNTIVNSQWLFSQMIGLEGVDILCMHNGISPDIYGMICQSKKQDDVDTEMVVRTSYYAIKLANEIKRIGVSNFYDAIEIDAPGDYCVPFVGFDEGTVIPVDSATYPIESIKVRYISGLYPYSSAGSIGAQSKEQPKNYEIKGITEVNLTDFDEVTIPNNSFGYFLFKAVEVNTPPTADAGNDRVVYLINGTASTTLSASNSFDENGNIVSYHWSSNTMAIADSAITTVNFNTPGKYTYTLIVIDDKGLSDSDTVTITVKNKKKRFWDGWFGKSKETKSESKN